MSSCWSSSHGRSLSIRRQKTTRSLCVRCARRRAHARGMSMCAQWFGGGLAVTLTLPISLSDIVLHLSRYTDPVKQRLVVRILFMVRACEPIAAAAAATATTTTITTTVYDNVCVRAAPIGACLRDRELAFIEIQERALRRRRRGPLLFPPGDDGVHIVGRHHSTSRLSAMRECAPLASSLAVSSHFSSVVFACRYEGAHNAADGYWCMYTEQ